MQWIAAKNRVPTITKYYIVRQNAWASTCYCDSNDSIKKMCDKEPDLDFDLVEWLDEDESSPSLPPQPESDAIEFADWLDENEWLYDHQEQVTHTRKELYQIFKSTKK